MPFWLLYRLSDVFFFFMYYVLGYRKKVVIQNLRNSFPEKNEQELKNIQKQFYQFLCDVFLETFKLLTISKKELQKHCQMTGQAQRIFDTYYHQKKSIVTVMGHLGNWEWAGHVFDSTKHQLYGLYHPLSNTYFNRLTVKMRTRFGMKLIDMKHTFREMVAHKAELTNTTFISDQTPQPNNAYWTTFLNQDTPIFTGIEKIAKKFNYPVLYVYLKREKRGYYKIYAQTLFDNPIETKENEISEAHARILEQHILQQPEVWLWSHRRWKHKRPELKK
ncbi:MAG: lysophospholipid acyltransferase family protein [Bacteroidetes bacterium]|nr:lysophospholipid acyltransferase family protein [Bacteroidota bacterium]